MSTPTTTAPSIVWERPHEEEAVRAIREANDILSDAVAAEREARESLHVAVWAANRKYRVTQQTIGDELGVTKSRVNSIINEYDEKQESTP